MTDAGDIDALLGQTIAGKYRVERVLGRGGMGAVYAATHISFNKRVALKFLDREAARDEDSVARFHREAEAASAVESAHIVQIFDSGNHEGQPYLVMEHLSGEDLRTRLKRDGRVPVADAAHIAAQVLRALARAHAAGIVHRDLKPDNVYLCRRDDDPMFVKIVDFGISKIARQSATNNTLTRRGTVLGTAFYMSPEQAQAFKDIDGRSDLFSLGTILFEALAGKPPHTGEAYEAILINICTKDAPELRSVAPDVPETLSAVIAKALRRDRNERYQTATEFYEALANALPEQVRSAVSQISVRDPFASLPDSGASTRGPKTEEGTAVRTERTERRSQKLRTAVLVVTVALFAFAATVFAMRGSGGDADASVGARGGPAATPSHDVASTSTSPSGPITPPSASAAPSTSAPLASPAPQPRPVPRPLPGPTPGKPAPKPGPTGVATGLQLDTSGP
ncbi:MAG: serine/threonine-protein kinase [Polyangiaceae bacterium]